MSKLKYPPTAKQIAHAKRLSKLANVKLPADYQADSMICSSFISKISKTTKLPATPAQVKAADDLFMATRLPRPKDYRSNFQACSDYITRAYNAPSLKQRTLAEELAIQHSNRLPVGYRESKTICHRFINSILKARL